MVQARISMLVRAVGVVAAVALTTFLLVGSRASAQPPPSIESVSVVTDGVCEGVVDGAAYLIADEVLAIPSGLVGIADQTFAIDDREVDLDETTLDALEQECEQALGVEGIVDAAFVVLPLDADDELVVVDANGNEFVVTPDEILFNANGEPIIIDENGNEIVVSLVDEVDEADEDEDQGGDGGDGVGGSASADGGSAEGEGENATAGDGGDGLGGDATANGGNADGEEAAGGTGGDATAGSGTGGDGGDASGEDATAGDGGDGVGGSASADGGNSSGDGAQGGTGGTASGGSGVGGAGGNASSEPTDEEPTEGED
jgi:hypothetical protein